MRARSPVCQPHYAGNHQALEPVRLVPLALEPRRLAYEAAQLEAELAPERDDPADGRPLPQGSRKTVQPESAF